MCGICGFTNPDPWDTSTIKRMCDIMAHRGPDGEGAYNDGDIVLGHRRLSLIDHAGGSQPMLRDKHVLVFNGEIYNYRELRTELRKLGYSFATNSDTEVLLVSYEAWGKELLNRVRGMFAFAIWDSTLKELFCARDFFGIKPFYYTQINEQFVFASEIKSILEHPAVPKVLNEEALEQYLSFQYSVLPETFFKGIYKLEPGHLLTVKPSSEPVVERYWHLDYDINEDLTAEEAENLTHKTLQDSVSCHMIADTEVASFLSSGVDSSYLTASLHDQGGAIQTFTVGFDTTEGEAYSEISLAQKIAAHLGIENCSHVISETEYWDSLEKVQWHMDEPMADPSAVALYFVDKEASKRVKAVLSGEGADELFGGYGIYQTPLENRKLRLIPPPVLRMGAWILDKLNCRGGNYLRRASKPLEEHFIGNACIFSEQERKELLKGADTSNAADSSDAADPSCEAVPSTLQQVTAPLYREVANHDELTRMQYIDMNLWLVGDILLKTDKMSMAHSLESRVPFLDKEVWRIARTLPSRLKVSTDTTKITLRKAAANLLPEQTCSHKKLGFPVPLRVWLKEDVYYHRVKACFTSPAAYTHFHTGQLLALLDEHRAGLADNSRKIWTVYTFLTWYNVYFDEAYAHKFFKASPEIDRGIKKEQCSRATPLQCVV